MNITVKVSTILLVIILSGCGSIVVISDPEALAPKIEFDCQVEGICEECLIIPKSGIAKDIKWGYFYDQVEGECKWIQYSSGPGCIPPPFKTIEECNCCCIENRNKSKK